MDYTDPTGEIAHIAWAAGLGGIFGFGGGFLESAFSQTMDGGDIDWMEALGSGVKGAITGAIQAGLLASGAGFPTALFANALAGTAGSAAEQYIGGGRIDPEKSILGGLSNAVSNAIYGTDPLGSGKEAFLRGMGDGAANAALSYLFDTTGNKGVSRAGGLPGLAGALFSPYEALRDPRRGCGSISPFVPVPGYGPAKGYQYEMPGAGSGNANTPKKFSICDFLLETVIGGITGGLSSAAFYGAGKGIERLMDGLRPKRDSGKPLSLKIGDSAEVNKAMEIVGKSNEEVFNVVGHGNSAGIEFRGRLLNAKEVADLIRNSPQYIGGKQIVKLYSCETGKGRNSFAQQLAKELNVEVKAPNKLIYPTTSNDFIIADKLFNRGDWISFKP